MSQNSCCVPGCRSTRKDGVPLHRFPNPEKAADKFKTWILNIGGELATLDHMTIYDNRHVCNKHFQDIHKYPKNKLCSLAIPVLHMPGQSFVPATQDTHTTQEPALSSSDVQDVQLDVLVSEQSLTTVKIQEPALPTTSNLQKINFSDVMTGHQEVPTVSKKIRGLGTKRRQQQNEINIISKGPHVSITEHKQFKSVLKQLKKCENDKLQLKRKYMIARKMTKTSI